MSKILDLPHKAETLISGKNKRENCVKENTKTKKTKQHNFFDFLSFSIIVLPLFSGSQNK